MNERTDKSSHLGGRSIYSVRPVQLGTGVEQKLTKIAVPCLEKPNKMILTARMPTSSLFENPECTCRCLMMGLETENILIRAQYYRKLFTRS